MYNSSWKSWNTGISDQVMEQIAELAQRYEPPYENVVLTGLTALYEICFEQA